MFLSKMNVMYCIGSHKRYLKVAIGLTLLYVISLSVLEIRSTQLYNKGMGYTLHHTNREKMQADHTNFEDSLGRKDKIFQTNVRRSSIDVYLINNGTSEIDSSCIENLGSTPAEDLAHVASIKFDGVQNYTNDLVPIVTRDPDPPEFPIFVTALSSNHFAESLFLLNHFNDTVRQRYKDIRLIVYDVGLRTYEIEIVREHCACEFRMFPFDNYPEHIRYLPSKSWKPLVVALVVRDCPLIVWMDASVRFHTSNLDKLIADTKRYGLLQYDHGRKPKGRETIAERTHYATFIFMDEKPCVFQNEGEKLSGLIWLFANQLVSNYILRPWVSCALTFGCMTPIKNSRSILHCDDAPAPNTYHLCHRFDQSVLGILYVRLFHRELTKHAFYSEYVGFDRFAGKRDRKNPISMTATSINFRKSL